VGPSPMRLIGAGNFLERDVYELTVEEIKVEEHFVAAALRAKSSGYDAVEIHGAHKSMVIFAMSRSVSDAGL